MSPRVLGPAVLIAVFAAGARDTGCIANLERAPVACPAIACDIDCPNGTKIGADGCPSCECEPTEHSSCKADSDCNADEACVEVVCVTAPCEPRCEKKAPQYTACLSDSECGKGEFCDTKNYCDAPPGCDPSVGGCLAVCYGRCVAENDGGNWSCDGAYLDANGSCVKKDGSKADPSCCRQPPTCGDGTEILCDAIPPKCEEPFVAGAYNGCWACYEPKTCGRQCTSDSECNPGDRCVADPTDLCNQPNVDCFRAGRHYCAPEKCGGVMCDMYCEYGFATDPATGCEICKCNEAPSCVCDEVYAPVCGSDGKTYSNACFAKCSGVYPVSEGECTNACNCTKEYKPVCGSDGNTYGNACEAGCANVMVVSDGPCSSTCMCTKEYKPVCGTDGKTYGNECEANCAGVKVGSYGECPLCTVTCVRYDPVCGMDGVTYPCGEPDALCHNTKVAYEGECRKDCASQCTTSEPVCGIDGNTYSCPEEAKCNGVMTITFGACQPSCNIQCLVPDVVCGSDGVTYGCGEAEAKCNGASVVHAGACGSICKADSDCKMGETCFISSVARRMYGECQPVGYCEVPEDCPRYGGPVIACVGKWLCEKNQCSYTCGQ